MKHIKHIVVAMALVISLVAVIAFAGCGKSVSYTFTGKYQPQQTEDAAPVNFELKLYTDGTLELAAGVKFTLSDSSEIISDGKATGTWSETEEAITISIKSADRTNPLDKEYVVDKADKNENGKLEFDLSLSLMSYIRPITLIQK